MTLPNVDIAAIQQRFKDAGYQWVEHVFNDGDSYDCWLRFTLSKNPQYLITNPCGDFGYGRYSRTMAWTQAALHLNDVQIGLVEEFKPKE